MVDKIIRPTMKFIYLGYAATILVVVALVILLMHLPWPASVPPVWQRWLPFLPVVLLLWPLRRHARNRARKVTIREDNLRYETGLLSRTTHTIQCWQIKDVIVHQGLGQRIFGVGDIVIETGDIADRVTLAHIDQPQEVADLIAQNTRRTPPVDPNA